MVIFNKLPTYYADGTASVAANGTNVTGVGTVWTSLQPGDLFGVHKGLAIPILEVVSATQLTLLYPWPGAAQTNALYCIQFIPRSVGTQEATRQLLLMLANGNLDAFAALIGSTDKIPIFTGPGALSLVSKNELTSGVSFNKQVAVLADRATYDNSPAGYTVFVNDVGDGRSAIYSKLSNATADWSTAGYITGPVGPMPVLTTSTATLAAGTSATAVISAISGGYNIAFSIPAGRSSGFPFTWSTTTTDANPGNGFIRANNASMASATLLFVSKTTAAGTSMASYLLGLASSTNPTTKGDLTLQRISDGATARFSVTAVTDASTYVKIAVSGHSGNVSFTNNGAINFDFSRAGDKGTDGSGTGDVVGPGGGVVDNDIVVFDGTTGKLIKKAPNNIIGNNLLAKLTTSAIKGRVTAGTGNVEDLTAPQVNQFLGGWEPIGVIDLTGLTVAVVNNLSAFAHIRCSGYFLVSGDAATIIQLSTDNGATFLTSTANYTYTLVDGNQNSTVSGTDGTFAGIMIGNGFVGSITTISGFNKPTNCISVGQHYSNITSGRWSRNISARVQSTTMRNAFRITPNVGGSTFTYGSVLIEGVRG